MPYSFKALPDLIVHTINDFLECDLEQEMKIVIFGKKEGSGISAVKRILQDGLHNAEIDFCLALSSV